MTDEQREETPLRESAPPDAPPVAGELADAPVPEAPPEEPPPRSRASEDGQWDGRAAQVELPDDAGGTRDTGQHQVTSAREESLDYDNRTSAMRLDLPKAEQVRDVAGEIHYHYTYASPLQANRAAGRVSVADLERVSRAHVTTSSDLALSEALSEERVVFYRGATGTGRSESATIVLDRLTGKSRTTSEVIVLEAAAGLAESLSQLETGCGHLLDASEESWADTIGQVQINQAREALGDSGFLVILVDADSVRSLPGPVADHVPPALEQVVIFHLAARLTRRGEPDRASAHGIADEACRMDTETKHWFDELSTSKTASPAEAVLLAEAILDWRRRHAADSTARPHVDEFRGRRRYEQAVVLLRRGDGKDSPLRQSYAISAAVLDGLDLSDVIDGAAELGALLAEIEHPGSPGQREIFAHPVDRWLRHVKRTPSRDRPDNRDGIVVNMPSRELARIVIELAWRDYDAARTPVLTWLMRLCETHPDDRVRIRAVQALAFIARDDYALIKERVLEPWSRTNRPVEHLAAAWLLEAIHLDGPLAEKVQELLRRWSRSGDVNKREVAVRAYGTAVARAVPQDAIMGVRIAAVLRGLGSLPELALREMYLLELTREVTEELTHWMRGFPEMRERAGKVLVRVSRVYRVVEGESRGPYDLLWRMAHTPEETGASIAQIAALWHIACSHEISRGVAWGMLGDWAQSCRDYPELSGAFTRLADEFEKAAAGDNDFRDRLAVYRRRWNSYLDEEAQK